METHPIILFDGICKFCNGAVNFAIQRDPKGQIHYATLQSAIGQQLCHQYGIDPQKMDSFVLIQNGQAYQKSTASLRACKLLNGGWPLLYGFIIVPAFIRDAVYSFIAKNRYKWFGKMDACMVPTPAIRARFLSDE